MTYVLLGQLPIFARYTNVRALWQKPLVFVTGERRRAAAAAQLVEQLLQTRGTRSIPVIGKIYTYRKCVYCQLFEKAKIKKKMPGMDIF